MRRFDKKKHINILNKKLNESNVYGDEDGNKSSVKLIKEDLVGFSKNLVRNMADEITNSYEVVEVSEVSPDGEEITLSLIQRDEDYEIGTISTSEVSGRYTFSYYGPRMDRRAKNFESTEEMREFIEALIKKYISNLNK